VREAYFEKFKDNLKLLKEVEIATPLPEAQAVRFLSGLNRAIFQELHHQLNNLPHFKMEYPKDLATADNVAVARSLGCSILKCGKLLS
jgi:hypothetical protein